MPIRKKYVKRPNDGTRMRSGSFARGKQTGKWITYERLQGDRVCVPGQNGAGNQP